MITFKYKDYNERQAIKLEQLYTQNYGSSKTDYQFKIIGFKGNQSWGFLSLEERNYVYDYINKCPYHNPFHDNLVISIPDYVPQKEEKVPTVKHIVKYKNHLDLIINSDCKIEKLHNYFYFCIVFLGSDNMLFEDEKERDYVYHHLKEIQAAIPNIESYDIITCNSSTEHIMTYTIKPFQASESKDIKDEKPDKRLYMSLEQILPFYKSGHRVSRKAWDNTNRAIGIFYDDTSPNSKKPWLSDDDVMAIDWYVE